jgi:chromosome segregation ATPase
VKGERAVANKKKNEPKATPVNADLSDVMNLDIKDELKGGKDPAPNRIRNIGDNAGGLIARLDTVNEELSGISGETTERLMDLLKSNEELTRETYLTQVEIKRASSLQESLMKNLAGHKDQIEMLDVETENLEKELEKLSKELNSLMSGNKELDGKKAGFDKDISRLKYERDVLANENAKLKIKQDKFAGEVASLKKIREEYLAQIAKFKELKDELLT